MPQSMPGSLTAPGVVHERGKDAESTEFTECVVVNRLQVVMEKLHWQLIYGMPPLDKIGECRFPFFYVKYQSSTLNGNVNYRQTNDSPGP